MRRRLAWWTDLSSSWTPQVGPGQQTELCMRVRKSHYLQKHLVLALEFHVFSVWQNTFQLMLSLSLSLWHWSTDRDVEHHSANTARCKCVWCGKLPSAALRTAWHGQQAFAVLAEWCFTSLSVDQLQSGLADLCFSLIQFSTDLWLHCRLVIALHDGKFL